LCDGCIGRSSEEGRKEVQIEAGSKFWNEYMQRARI